MPEASPRLIRTLRADHFKLGVLVKVLIDIVAIIRLLNVSLHIVDAKILILFDIVH